MTESLNASNHVLASEESYIPHWPDLVVPLIQAVNTSEFGDALFDSINRFVPIDSALVMLFRVDQEPTVLFERLHPAEEASFRDIYLGGAYLLSPLYRRFQSLRSGFYRLGALENQAFELSDFGVAYFNESGLCDDANFLQKLDGETALVASFGRQQLCTPFSDQELQQLHIADPVYRSALEKHWGVTSLANASGPDESSGAHKQLKSMLHRFGESILTDREQTVLRLIFEGKSSKMSSKELGISIDTERGHRKNIYAKLEVTSQAQLFSLIFSVLSHVEITGDGDPYASYITMRLK